MGLVSDLQYEVGRVAEAIWGLWNRSNPLELNDKRGLSRYYGGGTCAGSAFERMPPLG